MNEQLANFQVTDRNSFIEFLHLLRQDLLNDPEGWENNNLGSFLEALKAYAEDIQGYYDNTGRPVSAENPSWQVFADIFKGATMYE